VAIRRLKRRPEFLAVASSGLKAVAPGLILQARPRHDDEPLRVGFTASRKVGGAVQRNRARRRLKAATEQVLAAHGIAGHDYVVIARGESVKRPFALLLEDLDRAIARVARAQPAKPPSRR
jgi:ribonuclease P protein component